ncbi:hypothetical protein AB0B85_06900 [Micromonospora sp. NPDC049044]|uniref:hypothetical protein n=1 Tax=unclassified Micromonospora TaxID=2617518 RepID=UPI0033E755E8
MPAAPAAAVREQQREPADDAAISIRMLDIPASRVRDPRAQVYIVDHLNPGTTIHRRVEVQNSSGETQKIEFYSGAAAVEHNTFAVPEGRTGNELSGWIGLEAAEMELDPGERRPVEVEIAVPKKASKGERYAAIWAQVTSTNRQAGNVTQIHRVGIRVYLDIGPGGEPPTDFRIDALAAEPGPREFPVVTAKVTNTGQRAVDMTGTLSLKKAAVQAGPFTVTNGVTILPGQSGQVRVEVDQALPAGVWDVHAKLASGVVERTATGKIVLPVVAPMTASASGGPTWLVYPVAGVALLVLIILAGWHLVRRRRTRLA